MSSPLSDRFGRTHTYLRISLTDRCNFRCVYCMPPDGLSWLPNAQTLTADEIERLARVFVSLGVRKVRLTGGEPTVRRDLVDIVRRIGAIEGVNELAMTTNAYRLEPIAQDLRDAGLTALNVSLDSLRRERFRMISLRDGYDRVIAGLDAAIRVGVPTIKINVVALAGENDEELADFVEFAAQRQVRLRFIEFMPFQGNQWEKERVFPVANMISRLRDRFTLNPMEQEPSAVATEYHIPELDLVVGFIGSMTQPFCSTCNRVRLTADGKIKNCLFDHREVDVRDLLRSGGTDEDVIARIADSLSTKWRAHPPMNTLPQYDNRPMIAIGG